MVVLSEHGQFEGKEGGALADRASEAQKCFEQRILEFRSSNGSKHSRSESIFVFGVVEYMSRIPIEFEEGLTKRTKGK